MALRENRVESDKQLGNNAFYYGSENDKTWIKLQGLCLKIPRFLI
jgi:hypothetical protein